VVPKLLLKQEIAIDLLLHGFEGSAWKTGNGFAGGLILLGILQGADQADHLATWPLGPQLEMNQAAKDFNNQLSQIRNKADRIAHAPQEVYGPE
jgi:hypothetical protein